MTEAEAKEIVKIMLTADGGCSVCSADLLTRLVRSFPEYKKTTEDLYKQEFGHDLPRKEESR